MRHHRLSIKDNPEYCADDFDMMRCDCNHDAFPEEVHEVNGKTLCPNCRPTVEDRLNDWLDRCVAWIEGWCK